MTTYKIDEDDRRVKVTQENGSYGELPFTILQKYTDIDDFRRKFYKVPEERIVAYMIARDEMIDRGLIQEPGE